jgi:hypothetical protein
MPPDRDRAEPRQFADDHLGGIQQLGRELPVSNDNDPDHGQS